jgi:hypothetical protein
MCILQSLKCVLLSSLLLSASSCNNLSENKLPKWNDIELKFGEEISYLNENPQENPGVSYTEKALFEGKVVHFKKSFLGEEKIQFRTEKDKLSEIFFSKYCSDECTREDLDELKTNFLKSFLTPVESYFLSGDMSGEFIRYEYFCINEQYILQTTINLKNTLIFEFKKEECKNWKNPFKK